jgi:hypothetical protein
VGASLLASAGSPLRVPIQVDGTDRQRRGGGGKEHRLGILYLGQIRLLWPVPRLASKISLGLRDPLAISGTTTTHMVTVEFCRQPILKVVLTSHFHGAVRGALARIAVLYHRGGCRRFHLLKSLRWVYEWSVGPAEGRPGEYGRQFPLLALERRLAGSARGSGNLLAVPGKSEVLVVGLRPVVGARQLAA